MTMAYCGIGSFAVIPAECLPGVSSSLTLTLEARNGSEADARGAQISEPSKGPRRVDCGSSPSAG